MIVTKAILKLDLIYEGGPPKKWKYLLEGGTLVIQASSTR